MKMKRLTLFLTLLCISAALFAQGKVTTRKHLFADFSDKITKVVMSGNDIIDGVLRQEVVDLWTVSPFEFCSPAEYESLKKSDTYYFLLVTAGQAKGEDAPMVRFLTLEKGGADSGDNIALRTEVISLPMCPAEGGSGRELVFLPALVKGVQDFAVQDVVAAHHDFGDLVGEVGEQVLPGRHLALGEQGDAQEKQGGKGNQSLHNHTIFPYKDSATVRYFKITCYLCKL